MSGVASRPPFHFAALEGIAESQGLALVLVATVAIRLAAMVVLRQPLQSDDLSYFTIAKTLAQTGVPTDNFGNHAFFSPGYPLILAPAFALFGASKGVALAVNLVLASASAWLVWRLAYVLGGSAIRATLAGLGFALWLPGIWEATALARENLSVPLMLAFVLSLIAMGGRSPARASVAAGLSFGAGLLAGTSVALTLAGFGAAWLLLVRRGDAARVGLGFVLAVLIVLTPWFAGTNAMFGRPMLTTSGGFNLYIGNNPVADGQFVSIRYTPLGPVWHQRYAELGEVDSATWLGAEARSYALAHPTRTAEQGLLKLALFWAPNLPDGEDWSASALLAGMRALEVVQYLLIVGLAVFAGVSGAVWPRHRWVLAATIAGFWAIHAATYIIPRYRDPIMPLLIVLAALGLSIRLRKPVDER